MDTSSDQGAVWEKKGKRHPLTENTELAFSLLFGFTYCILGVRSVLHACLYMHHKCARIPGTGVTDGREVPPSAGN